MNQYRKNERRASSIRTRLVVLLTTLCMVGAFGTGCTDRDVTVGGENQSTENGNNENNSNQENNRNNVDSPYDDEYLDHHGPDDDEVLTDAGVLQGSWRSAFVEGDKPLAYFDIFHDDGESSATGDYLMGMAISDMFDGRTGEIHEVTINDGEVEVQWNPTDSQEELYTLTLQREDEDTYTGSFTAAQYPETHEVSVTRRVFDD